MNVRDPVAATRIVGAERETVLVRDTRHHRVFRFSIGMEMIGVNPEGALR
jgi:hypothetical protein